VTATCGRDYRDDRPATSSDKTEQN